jgi:4-amino-4-deoxy-L-arabinose transferase-like glycosyltransferase
VPWHWLASKAHPAFLEFYFIHEHFTRFLTEEHRRHQPFWFLIPVVLVGLLPWGVFLPQALKNAWRERREPHTLFLLLWAGLPFVFFSISDSKLIAYMLPVLPPLAMLLGRVMANASQRAAFFLATLWILLAIAGAYVLLFPPAKIATLLVDAQFAAWGLVGLFALSSLMLGLALLQHQPPARWLRLILVCAAMQWLAVDAGASLYTEDSVKNFAAIIQRDLPADTEVATFHHYYQDLPVYLGRTVTVVNWQGELEFGMTLAPETSQWMIDEATFWQRWLSEKPMAAVMRRGAAEAVVPPEGAMWRVVAENSKNRLISNQQK